MQTVLTREEMKRSDAATWNRIPSRTLMLNAAKALVPFVKGRTAIVCGRGNNGGDGYALATLLDNCTVFAVGAPETQDARYYRDAFTSSGGTIVSFGETHGFDGFDCVVDCIFGIGFHGVPEGAERAAIEAINACGAFIVSADINSGLCCDSGLGEVCVVSDVTVSFGAFKPGHFLARAKDVIGKVINRNIGIEPLGSGIALAQENDFSSVLPKRLNNSHKGTYGTVAIVGGCTNYAGAVKLANLSCSAMRSGCGICRLVVPAEIVNSVSLLLLESTLFPLTGTDDVTTALGGVKAAAVGMGWGRNADRLEMLKNILSLPDIELIIDADGINALSLEPSLLGKTGSRVTLTPHPAELARLTGETVGEILSHPIESARSFARKYNCTVLLKGASSVVTDGEKTFITDRGCPGMASAGSGDVLSGIIAGLYGYNNHSLLVPACGAYIAGMAGEMAQSSINAISMTASDTVKFIPDAVGQLIKA